MALHFYRDFDVFSCKLYAFCDASFKNLPNGASQGAFICFLIDSEGNYCPIAWQSRKIRRVVKSTIAAECLAALDAAEMIMYLSVVLKELLNVESMETIVLCDNKSLVSSVNSCTNLDDKALLIDICVLRDLLGKKLINNFQWVSSDLQLANCLTKQGAPDKYFIDVLNNHKYFCHDTGAFK